MYTEFEIRQLHLSLPHHRQMVERFLSQNGLKLDDVDYYAGVFPIDGDDLLAGGGLYRDIIKCIAVTKSLRDEGMSNRLISHLISMANNRGYHCIKVFTKPENKDIFESMSFRLLAEAPKAILMETGTNGIDRYCRYLHSLRRDMPTGIIVMNANPFTRGHRYLIERAAQQIAHLCIIVVKEELSLFPYQERLEMITDGCKDLPNVTVCEGSDYAISAATFPTYFLKEIDEATDTQILLDLNLYIRHIAPALGASIRFLGSEPTDSLTHRYNEMMAKTLPKVCVIERLQFNGKPVCATNVRQSIAKGRLHETLHLIHPTTIPYIIAHLATRALQIELDTTPKPGLVDCHDNGAHQDMNYELMQRSIRILHPFFVKLAQLGFQESIPAISDIRRLGVDAEQQMLTATGQVNTHKGALFALGLAVVATAFTTYNNDTDFQPVIIQLANLFPAATETHGSQVLKNFPIKGALANAQTGYAQLLHNWLPFFEQHSSDKHAIHKTLLRIMSELDDTNIYYRKGQKTATRVKAEAQILLDNFSIDGLEDMNRRFINENISPGGSADMLSLTIFIHSIFS